MEAWRLIFLGGSVFFLALAFAVFRGGTTYKRTRARQAREAQDFLSRTVSAPGIVVGVETATERFFTGYLNDKVRVTYPIVRFQTAQGHPVDTRLEVGVERNPPAVGQPVEVCYDATQPMHARLRAAIYPPRFSWRGASGCLMVGFAGGYVGIALLGIVLAIFAPA